MTQLNGFGRSDGPCLVFLDHYPADDTAHDRFDLDRSSLYTNLGCLLARLDRVGSFGRGCAICCDCGDGAARDFDLCKRENISNPAILSSWSPITLIGILTMIDYDVGCYCPFDDGDARENQATLQCMQISIILQGVCQIMQ